jgi:uncharacterized membrane protein
MSVDDALKYIVSMGVVSPTMPQHLLPKATQQVAQQAAQK